ncbi:AbrB/MazE/SpoVT family DNA-binding domain-containing protein [Yersinia enterocolitica]|uniref:AbrB/MazE/SpoVT family DNA-binding domain-containing protein n=1 Tax=Yersinia TaxID=629 RepID=UPI0021E8B281|nr:AbrB/MazE/SpoVT family DNA-binding domain-containing protein [Yersinia enterocolitica]EKN4689933.1 AbrB/MazE/SpoVT family DNA-binding domain-containing protein [Yersinia ruckeri]EKN4883319.1 AbrB/MazE/SpoVT family DNA-binding domain-containing protein [Yersinia enterocolitica]EKN6017389.1 AbrB/MazE/SpoVT family DNA-binding domain-containing protein [Yersinia enterocolitica]EKN6093746.1 AbrB/MazE/SpoVT family DNA-binding domain-containing protein [Yersinia enterocolitica]MCV3314331.1 AbrB/Ma
MTTAIGKWGNGAGLRIPQPFLKQLGLAIGDSVNFQITNTELIISKSGPSLEELLRQCSPENRHDELFCDSQGKEML